MPRGTRSSARRSNSKAAAVAEPASDMVSSTGRATGTSDLTWTGVNGTLPYSGSRDWRENPRREFFLRSRQVDPSRAHGRPTKTRARRSGA